MTHSRSMITEGSTTDARISKALVTAAAMTLLLVAACGGSPTSPGSVAPSAPAPAPATSTSTPPATSPGAKPSDATEAVKDASETFVKTALTLDYADGAGDDYAARVKPLMTKRGYELSSVISTAAEQARSRFGKNARSNPKILSGTKVKTLSADQATTTVNFTPRVQELKDGRWRTIKAGAVDETEKLTLVKDGDRWLVDKFQ